MAHDIAETTKIERVPRGREEVPVQLSRLLEAHEQILTQARALAEKSDEMGDQGTNDLMASDVIRVNEMQVWFVAEHLVDTPLVRANRVSEQSEQPAMHPTSREVGSHSGTVTCPRSSVR